MKDFFAAIPTFKVNTQFIAYFWYADVEHNDMMLCARAETEDDATIRVMRALTKILAPDDWNIDVPG